jgi:hypothetical protein
MHWGTYLLQNNNRVCVICHVSVSITYGYILKTIQREQFFKHFSVYIRHDNKQLTSFLIEQVTSDGIYDLYPEAARSEFR